MTPLLGGRSSGAVCSLLQVGDTRILLDCGRDPADAPLVTLQLARRLLAEGGLDLILLSHADNAHVSRPPIAFVCAEPYALLL